MKTRARGALLVLVLALGVAAAGEYWLTPAGTALTAGSVSPRKPGRLKAGTQPDGRGQLVVRVWWMPVLGAPASIQLTVGGRTTSSVEPSAPVRIPFERRSLTQPGTVVVLGVAWTGRQPNQAGWDIWENGKQVRQGTAQRGFTVRYVTSGE